MLYILCSYLVYYGIVNGCDLQWYTDMLENWKLLDINDFLHNFCPYVVNQPCIKNSPQTTSQLSNPSSSAPPARTFIEFDIFQDDQENAGLRSQAATANLPNWGTSFPSGGIQINEFGTNDGIEFMRDAALSSTGPGSSSRGYRAQAQMEHLALGLDGGKGCQSARPWSVVRPCAEGSQEQRDTSQRGHSNAPRCNAHSNTGGDEDEHDD